MTLNPEEALRYLGAGRDAPAELRREVVNTAETLMNMVQPRFVYRVFPLDRSPDESENFRLRGTELVLSGKTAAVMLSQCHTAAVLLCTLGARFEAALRSAQARDMAKAVILDACGSAWVEAGCDAAELEIAARVPGQFLTDRFSPGYGDLPLSLQSGICTLLDGGRRLGVQVTESCLMNPSKTVSAADRPQMARVRGCAFCQMRDHCSIRKSGKRCEL